MDLRIDSDLSGEETRYLQDKLDEFNDRAVGSRNFSDVGLALRDEAGEVVGGLIGTINWDWLHISVLWVADSLRGRGHGRELLVSAERVAKDRGCEFAKLHTFDFQARSFYEDQGYQVISQTDGYPRGHTQFSC